MDSHLDPRTRKLIKRIDEAVWQYKMIRDGDRVAVAVSGGKDSLSLLRLLNLRRQTSRARYEVAAIHIAGDANGPTEPYQPLVDWLQREGIPFAVKPVYLPEGEVLPMECQRCTRNRRKVIFETALEMGCNVVAFGHHADDLAQTTLLSLIHKGQLETMAPRRDYYGQIRLIRPMMRLSDEEIRRYAESAGFPPPPPECPRSDTSGRKAAGELVRLALLESKDARKNMINAALRAMAGSGEFGPDPDETSD